MRRRCCQPRPKTADSAETTFAGLDIEDWDQAIAELPGKYLAGSPVWLMSRAAWAGSCLTLSASAGGAPVPATLRRICDADARVL